jgi:hypothetical protein
VMVCQKEAPTRLKLGFFHNQIRKCRHAEFPGNPVVDVFEGVNPQFPGGLDNAEECIFCCCPSLGYPFRVYP